MSLMKKSIIYGVLLFLIFSLSTLNKDKGSNEFVPSTAKAAGWEFTVEDFQLNDSLEDIRTIVDYEGVSTSNPVSKVPEDGKTFLLLKMVIEKKDSSETIEWDKLTLKDSSNKTYSRLQDNFLEEFGFKRMKGTTLSFGRNEGWLAFEVDKNSSGFNLQYDFRNVLLSVDLTK